MLSNVKGSPQTTITGILIGLVGLAGALSHWNAGPPWLTSACLAIVGILSPILGALAVDPSKGPPSPPAGSATGAASKVVGLSALLLTGALSLPGCTASGQLNPAVAPVVGVIDQIICKIVSVEVPGNGGSAGSICDTAATAVSGVLNGFTAAERAKLVSAQTCHLVPITPDGVHGEGEICDWICGDMSKATPANPCPAVDAKLPPYAAFAKAGKS